MRKTIQLCLLTTVLKGEFTLEINNTGGGNDDFYGRTRLLMILKSRTLPSGIKVGRKKINFFFLLLNYHYADSQYLKKFFLSSIIEVE